MRSATQLEGNKLAAAFGAQLKFLLFRIKNVKISIFRPVFNGVSHFLPLVS
jgi:hypothetical protein